MTSHRLAGLVLCAAALMFTNANLYGATGNSFNGEGTFVDNKSGVTYHVVIDAIESAEAGVGNVLLRLYDMSASPRLGLITVHETAPPIPGSFPETTRQAGSAGYQAIDIDHGHVEISAHAFAHSDAPNIVFVGLVTVDVRLNLNSGNIKVVISSPKGEMKLEGKVTPDQP